jgi:hypothetical protein
MQQNYSGTSLSSIPHTKLLFSMSSLIQNAIQHYSRCWIGTNKLTIENNGKVPVTDTLYLKNSTITNAVQIPTVGICIL